MWPVHPFVPLTLTLAVVLAGAAATHMAPVRGKARPGPPAAVRPASPSPVVSTPVTTKQELGRLLFWDPILSGDRDIACATCHHPDFAYTDARDLPLGTGSVGLGTDRAKVREDGIAVVPRNAPSVLNTAFNGLDRRRGRRRRRRRDDFGIITEAVRDVDPARAPMFWDNRIRGLEAQALEPIKVREELRGDAYPEAVALDSVVARLRAIPEYVQRFQEVFGTGTSIDARQIGDAIAAFERTLIAVNSPFDRFLAGDQDALTPQQQRGLRSFREADCTECHDGPMLSDFELHAEGVEENPKLADPDDGDGRFRFRTPSLRNVALTAPYMHNGMLATLEDVIRFYDRGRSDNPNVRDARRRRRGRNRDRDRDRNVARLDRDFRRVDDMTDREMRDIIAFLESLTDLDFDRTIPTRVPSGLPPGGHLVTK